MNKRAFTLIELLAVIVIISIVGLITAPIILDNIEKSRIEMYRNNVKTAIDNAKEYVSKNMRNNDFPSGGLEVMSLNIKNNNFKSGIIDRCPTSNFEGTDCDKKNLEPGEIYVKNIYNGKYCANGTKQNLIVSKVKSEKECDLIDSTGPELSVKLVRVTNNSILVNAYGYDSQTKILKYTFQIGDNEPVEIYTSQTVASYEFTGLKRVEGAGGFDITVTVSNINALSSDEQYKKNPSSHTTVDTSLKKIELRDVGLPTFKVSGNNYANTKEITITYPSIVGGENYYVIGNELPVKVDSSTTKIALSKNVKVTAYTIYGENRAENSINIAGIDDKGPIIEVLSDDTWEHEKVLTVIVKDIGAGLGKKSCSFDGGKTWIATKTRTINGEKKTVCEKVYKSNQTINFEARDKLGNISTLDIAINHIDTEPPSCTTIYEFPVNYSADWTNQNVILRGKCEDDLSGCEGDISFTYTTEKNGEYLPSIDGVIRDRAGNETVCSKLAVKIDKTPPKCSGKIGGNTTWTKNNITVGAYCKDDSSEYNSSCQEDYYLEQLTSDGMQETKSILIYDKAGNVTSCGYTYDKYIDKTNPTCGSPVGGNTSWKKGSIDVGVNCTDGTNTSGCAQNTFYSTLTTTGTVEDKTITIRDKAGNTEECTNTYNKWLDNTGPKCIGQFGGKTNWTAKQNVTVGAYCQDNESGCTSDSFTSSITGTGKTTKGIVTIKDKVGNTTDCEYTYDTYVDTIPPKCNGQFGGKTNWTGSANVTVGAYCQDDETGCTQDSYTTTITGTGKTTKGIVTIKDNAGNTTNCSYDYNTYVDTIPPKCNGQFGGKTNWTGEQFVTVGAYCQDDETGCTQDSFTKSIWGTGQTTSATIQIKDNVGNTADCTYSYNTYVDNVAPWCGTPFGGKTNWTTNQNVTVGVNCTDNQSGCEQNQYTTTISGNGTSEYKTITIKDKVGNTTNCYNLYNKYIDIYAPSCSQYGGNYSWTRNSVNVGVYCNETISGSGCVQSSYSTTLTTEGMSESKSFTISDKAGNKTTCSYNYSKYIDKTAPPCGVLSYYKIYGTSYRVSMNCYDSLSGCTNAVPSTTVTGTGSKFVTLTLSDMAGNSRACSGSVYISPY